MLIDEFLPEGDVRSRHETYVRADPATVYRALLDVDLKRSRGVSLLFRMRGMPGSALTLEGLERLRFARLGEELDQEVVLGLIGQFWTRAGGLKATGPEHFRDFKQEGFAKAVWGFALEPAVGGRSGTLLSTETRVQCLDDRSQRNFLRYWKVVSPFSRWVRKETLRLVKEDAERQASAGPGLREREQSG